MKKLILICLCSLFANASSFGLSNLEYTFNFSDSTCEKSSFEEKKMIYTWVQNKEWFIDEIVDIDSGVVTTIVAEDKYGRIHTGFYASNIETCLWIKKNELKFRK